MNLGQRKARVVLSVAIEAALMVVPLHLGDKSGTSSAAHMQQLRTHRDGQDAFWGIVEGNQVHSFGGERKRESPCDSTGSHMDWVWALHY